MLPLAVLVALQLRVVLPLAVLVALQLPFVLPLAVLVKHWLLSRCLAVEFLDLVRQQSLDPLLAELLQH